MTIEEEETLINKFQQETRKSYHSLSIPYLKWRQTQISEELHRVNAKFFSASSILDNIQKNMQKIFKRIANLEYRLKTLESQELTPKKKKPTDISDDHFFRILGVVYNSMEKRFGDFVSVSKLTESIKQYIPLPTEKIHSQLYELFMNYKIDLQTGKNVGGTPLIQDGKEFVWFKFK